jgi:hypothetical protein
MSSNSQIAAAAARIASDLAQYDHLPAPSWLSIGASGRNWMNFMLIGGDPYAELRAVCAWAAEFDVFINVSLSFGGGGEATVDVDLGGETVQCKASVNSAHAYELGRKLGQPLTKNALRISGPDLLAAMTADGEKTAVAS